MKQESIALYHGYESEATTKAVASGMAAITYAIQAICSVGSNIVTHLILLNHFSSIH